jgi:hypothetical protein
MIVADAEKGASTLAEGVAAEDTRAPRARRRRFWRR